MVSVGVTTVKSSVPYQIFLNLDVFYALFYTLAEILIFIFKGVNLPYPVGVLAAEIVLVLVLLGLQQLRIHIGKRGNLGEKNIAIILSIVLTIPAALGLVFILIWQTYVLRVEVILSAIGLAMILFQTIFGIVALSSISRRSSPTAPPPPPATATAAAAQATAKNK